MTNSLDGLEVTVFEQYTQENYQISDGLIEYIGRFHWLWNDEIEKAAN
jgi:hypothetical protein